MRHAVQARRMIIAGNWKMNKTVAEALALVRELRGMVSMVRDTVEVVVAPPFTALHAGGQGAGGLEHRAGGAELPLGGVGRLHRRGLARRC